MDLSALLLLLAVLVMVVLFVARPFIEHWKVRAGSDRTGSALLAERERVLSALQELDFDHGLGKVPEGEYSDQREHLLKRGAEILRQLDSSQLAPIPAAAQASGPGQTAQQEPGSVQSDEELEALIDRRRSIRQAKTAGFCSRCGKPVLQSDRFCPSCGDKLEE